MKTKTKSVLLDWALNQINAMQDCVDEIRIPDKWDEWNNLYDALEEVRATLEHMKKEWGSHYEK